MCGIAGFISRHCSERTLLKMGDMLTHRGPDETGWYFRQGIGLINKRLSIIDLDNGRQPAFSEDGNVVVILNGEIFNYPELSCELTAMGHSMANRSDTAILPHLYEEYGSGMFRRLSGQFAIAVYDKREEQLVLARDRMGILPLHYSHQNGEFIFGSEIKAILAAGRTGKELSAQALSDVFTFWSPQSGRTIFRDVQSLRPGEILSIGHGLISRNLYHQPEFRKPEHLSSDLAAEEAEELLLKAVQKRLIGDVKIASYLSGGLDSSLVTSIIASRFDSTVEAYSVCFEEEQFDEYPYQKLVCERLGIRHKTILFRNDDVPGLLREIIRHTEAPLLRAGPIPLFRLSELVNRNGVKVVLSGEGADELFGGYDLFREVKIRSYLKRYPDSTFRSALFRRVNQFSDPRLQTGSSGSLNYFYNAAGESGPLGSHMMDSHLVRWRQFGFFERFFSGELKNMLEAQRRRDYREMLELEGVRGMAQWTDIQRSQFLEIRTFLSQYLLSSQGDRMSMAHSVEVRFPFLDDELDDYCMALDDSLKLRALNEKYLLKKIAAKYLPGEVIRRKKFPYRSPVKVRSILSDPYLGYLLSEEALQAQRIFHPQKISSFLRDAAAREPLTERETMLFLGVLTLQILCDIFQAEIGEL